MWIFTTRGFVSIVENKDNRDELVVRARVKSHLVSFLGTDKGIFKSEYSDYRWRAFVPRDVVTAALVRHSESIDYDNFKARTKVNDPELEKLYESVWFQGMRYQMRDERSGDGHFNEWPASRRPINKTWEKTTRKRKRSR